MRFWEIFMNYGYEHVLSVRQKLTENLLHSQILQLKTTEFINEKTFTEQFTGVATECSEFECYSQS